MNRAELKNLLEKHHNASFGWALNCCYQDPDQAEEVLQTVYLKILDGRAHFSGKSSFLTWLFAVIRKTAIDEHRRRKFRQMRFSSKESDLQGRLSVDETEEASERSQIRRLIRQALDTLPRRQREVLHLVFYQALTLEEASKVMGISIGSVRKHYDRGKRRVHQWLEQSKVLDELR